MDYRFDRSKKTSPINIKEICRKFENGGSTQERGKALSRAQVSNDSISKTTSRPTLGPKPTLATTSTEQQKECQVPVRPARTRKNSPKKKHLDDAPKVVGGRPTVGNHINPVPQGGSAPRQNNGKISFRTRTSSLSVAERKKLYEELGNVARTNGEKTPQTVQNYSQVNGQSVNGCHVTYAVPIKFSEASGRYRRVSSLNGYDRQRSTPNDFRENSSSAVESASQPPRKPPRTFAHDKYLANQSPLLESSGIPHLKNDGLKKVRNVANSNGHSSPRLPPKPPFAKLNKKYSSPTNTVPYEYATPVKKGKVPKSNDFFDVAYKNYGTLRRSFSEEHVYEEPSDSIPTCSKRISRIDYTTPREHHGQQSPPQLHYLCVPLLDHRTNQLGSSKTLCSPRKRSPLERFNSPKAGKASLNNIRDMVNQSFVQLWRRLYPHAGIGDAGEHDTTEDVGADSGSEVSMKDVQERIIYVRSLRKQVIGTPSRREPSSVCKRLFDSIVISCLCAPKSGQMKPRLVFKFPKQQKDMVYDQTMIPELSFADFATLKPSSAYENKFLF